MDMQSYYLRNFKSRLLVIIMGCIRYAFLIFIIIYYYKCVNVCGLTNGAERCFYVGKG